MWKAKITACMISECKRKTLLCAIRPLPLSPAVQAEFEPFAVGIVHLQSSLLFVTHHPCSIDCSIPADQLLFRKRFHSSFFQVQRNRARRCSPLPDQLIFVASCLGDQVAGPALLAVVRQQRCQIVRQGIVLGFVLSRCRNMAACSVVA